MSQQESTRIRNRRRSDSSQNLRPIQPRSIAKGNKGIYLMKHCVIICSIYFQENYNVKLIPGTQGPLTPGKKNKRRFQFQRKRFKTAILHNLETTT